MIKELKANDVIIMDKNEVLLKFKKSSFSEIIRKNHGFSSIYQLFPYASLGFDPQKSLEEVLKSLKNLNTRLSNLKKINKSLNKFVNESSQLNWSDLQKINIEISDED